MNRLAEFGAKVEPIGFNKWALEGTYGVFYIELQDAGNWQVTGKDRQEPAATLQIALMRAYNLALGFTK